MPCSEIIEVGFGVAFFAGEFVVVGVVREELEFAAPGIKIRLVQDPSAGI
jgi:hypothetical protein